MLFSQPTSWKVSYSTPIMVHTAVTVILEYFIKWTFQVNELINYVAWKFSYKFRSLLCIPFFKH